MKVVTVCAFKGGVGKTTTALNVARGLARTGAAVLALDLDRTSHTLASFAGAVDGVLVQATTPGRVAGIVARNSFDYAVLDCPPSLARESASALRIADVVIVPVPPEMPAALALVSFLSAVDAARSVSLGGNVGLRVLLLLTMCDKRDSEAGQIERAIRDKMAGYPGLEVWPDAITRSPLISAANNAGRSVLDHAPRCEGARIYRGLADHIAATIAKKAVASI